MKIKPSQYAKLIFSETEGVSDQGQVDGVLKKIAGIILKNRDEQLIDKIGREYVELFKKDGDSLEMVVQSAREVSSSALEALREKISKLRNVETSAVSIRSEIVPELKGGIIVRVGDEIIDASASAKLRRVKEALLT